MAVISCAKQYGSLYEAMAPHVKTINQVFYNDKDYQRYSDLYLDAVRHRNALFLKAAILREAAALDQQEEEARDLFEQPSYNDLFKDLKKFKLELRKHKAGYLEHYGEKEAAAPKQKLNAWTNENTASPTASSAAHQMLSRVQTKTRVPLTPLNYFNAMIAKAKK